MDERELTNEYCAFCRLYQQEITVRQLSECVECHYGLKNGMEIVDIILKYKKT